MKLYFCVTSDERALMISLSICKETWESGRQIQKILVNFARQKNEIHNSIN